MSEPTPEEIHGDEVTEAMRIMPVPVDVQGIMRAQIIPAPYFSVISYGALGTTAERIVTAEPRRSRLTIVTNGFVKIGPSAAQCDAHGAPWPANVIPIDMTHSGEVWAKANTGTIELIALAEYWTE